MRRAEIVENIVMDQSYQVKTFQSVVLIAVVSCLFLSVIVVNIHSSWTTTTPLLFY